MRILIALLFVPMPALADVVSSPPVTCERDERVQLAAASSVPKGFQRLDRLPPAAEFLAVYRRVGQCPAPVVVRYNIGTARR